MPLDQHTIEVPDGASPARQDRTLIGSLPNQANAAGAAGVTVTIAVAMTNLPPNYSVVVNPGQGCAWSVTGKTNTGFNVNLIPLSATVSIAAGSFDVVVVA